MSDIIIERVAIPEMPVNRKYPFDEMEVGTSFRVEIDKKESAVSAGYAFFKRRGINASFRTKEEGNKVRVVRMK